MVHNWRSYNPQYNNLLFDPLCIAYVEQPRRGAGWWHRRLVCIDIETNGTRQGGKRQTPKGVRPNINDDDDDDDDDDDENPTKSKSRSRFC